VSNRCTEKEKTLDQDRGPAETREWLDALDAAELDRRGIKSWSGKPWNAVSVRNTMVRLGFLTTGGAS